MKFIRLVWFDLKNGYFKNFFLLFAPIVITLFGCMEVKRLGTVWEEQVGAMDCWVYLYGGMKEYIPMAGNGFEFPAIWMLVFLMSAFCTLNYPMHDLHKMGRNVLVSGKSRKLWWFSKCSWNFLATVGYHGAILLIIFIICKVLRMPLARKMNAAFIVNFFGMGTTEFVGDEKMSFAVMGSVLLFSIAINMLQMVLTLYMKPIFSFLIVCIILLSSSYFMLPIMIGNYGMVMRYQGIIENGVSQKVGVMISLGILLGSILVGNRRFRKYDILNQE